MTVDPATTADDDDAPAGPLDWAPMLEAIDRNQRFTITTHVRPDADAIGSAVGLAALLQRMGKLARIINPSETPSYLQWLDFGEWVSKIGTDVSPQEAMDTDAHIVVDTSAWVQIGDVADVYRETAAEKIVIDHHVSSDDLGAREFKDTKAAAAGVLVTELYRVAGVTPRPEVATALYCAIATDTGWYRFPSVDGRTMRVAGDLIDFGAEPNKIHKRLYERSSLARLKLQSRMLDRIELAHEGRLAYSYILRQDIDDVGAHPSESEGFVNQCLSLEGVDSAFLIVEQLDGRMKTSLRGRPPVDVAAVAEPLGGGGHKLAAGVMLEMSIEEAIRTLVDAIGGALAKAPAGGDTA